MEKNVIVVDEQGNQYEATYPKRAKGLVKSGRARFIDEHTICLACPPNIDLEDSQMSENTTVTTTQPEIGSEKLTVNYILEQIEKISAQTDYLHATIVELGNMPVGQGPNDVAGKAKAMALGNVVQAREATNQRLLEFYEKLYDDLNPRRSRDQRVDQELLMQDLKNAIENPDIDPDVKEFYKQSLTGLWNKTVR